VEIVWRRLFSPCGMRCERLGNIQIVLTAGRGVLGIVKTNLANIITIMT
jgi:hypothetical protein